MTETSSDLLSRQLPQAARNIAAIAISTILSNAIGFVWVILLSRLISIADFGMWGVIGALIGIGTTIPEFGMGLIVLRDVAQRPTQAGLYLGATLIVQPLLAILGCILLIGIGWLLPYDGATRTLLAVGSLSLIVDVFGNMCHNQLLAVEQMVTTSVIDVIHTIVLSLFALVALLAGGGLLGLYVATIIGGIFRAAMFWIILIRRGIKPRFPVDLTLIRHLFRSGWPIALGAFLQLTYRQIDKIIVLAVIASKNDVAYLTTAYVIVFGVSELTSSTVLMALSPLMARLAHDQPAALRSLVDGLAFLLLVLLLPVGIGISQLSASLAALLFPGFTGTAGILQILIWQAVLAVISDIYAQSMVVRNRQRQVLIIRVCGLIINAGLNILLLPHIGVQGAAVAILIAQAVVLSLLLIEHRPDQATVRRLAGYGLRVGLASVAMIVCIAILREANLFVAGLLGAAVYGAVILVLRALAPEHWAMLRELIMVLPIIGPAIAQHLPQMT